MIHLRNLMWFSLAFLLVVSACQNPIEEEYVEGYKPVYISKQYLETVVVTTPTTMVHPGKIYLYGKYLFINELQEGIHIVDNSDPVHPVFKKFIKIPGNIDMAIKSNVLYADNITDLVAFDISDMENITLTKRIKNIYTLETQLYPAAIMGYPFECVDTTKGYVLKWEKTTLKDPKCYR